MPAIKSSADLRNEELTSRFELYSQIKEGMDDIATGNTRPFSEAMADIRSRRNR